MKSVIRIIRLASDYIRYIVGSLLFNLISTFFGLFSFVLLAPLLDVIFGSSDDRYERILADGEPLFSFSSEYFVGYLNYQLAELIESDGKAYTLLIVCAVIGIAVLSKNVFAYIGTVCTSVAVNRSIRDLRNKIYRELVYLPLSYISDERKGEIIAKSTNDVQEIEWSLLSAISGFFKEPINLLVFFVTLFIMSFKLSLFILIFLPITAVVISLISKSLRKNTKTAQENFGHLISYLEETLNGFKLIKAFNNEKRFVRRFEASNNEFTKNKMLAFIKSDLASPISEFIGVTAVIGVLWYGGSLVFEGQLQASFFITYIVLFSQLINPLKALSKAIYDSQKGNSALDRIEEILHAKDIHSIPSGSVEKQTLDKLISFENVTFSYGQEAVLRSVSFDVRKGATVALVGQSGSGKSTIANLLPRFYDVQSGAITIDGIDIKELSISSLRSMMGMVTQESILFNDSVSNNIIFSDKEIDARDVIEAAKVANAHEFIEALESGYETNIGDGGNKLSGGQRQRLSIARAILANPPILILDEATSALDTESEKLVQEALFRLMENRTSLIIAHRLSTIQHADEILVVQDGQIAERGKHDELIAMDGVYKKLYELQSFD
jgi:subfamily B ATP-binding cassette protein MsbA